MQLVKCVLLYKETLLGPAVALPERSFLICNLQGLHCASTECHIGVEPAVVAQSLIFLSSREGYQSSCYHYSSNPFFVKT